MFNTTHGDFSPARPIATARINAALDAARKMSRHDEFLLGYSLSDMLTAPWRTQGYRPVDRDCNEDGYPVAEQFVILQHPDRPDEFIAFAAYGKGARSGYDRIPASMRAQAFIEDAEFAWGRGVQGTLHEILDWSFRMDGNGYSGVRATVSLHDVAVCNLPQPLLDKARYDMCRETKTLVRSRVEEMTRLIEGSLLPPVGSTMTVEQVLAITVLRLREWVDETPVEEFLPETEPTYDYLIPEKALEFVAKHYPGWLLPVAEGGSLY